MSKMIQCDSCKKLFVDDSTSKGKIHELWIDHETGFHACDECLLKMLKEYFPEVYDWEMSSREDRLSIKTGKWILDDEDANSWECSECGGLLQINDGTPHENDWYFCPYCGSKLEEPKPPKEQDV